MVDDSNNLRPFHDFKSARSSVKDVQGRIKYYEKRKEHRKLIQRKRHAYISNLNKEIDKQGHIELEWDSFKKIKDQNSSKKEDIDLYDLAFFMDLDSEKTIDSETIDKLNLKNETSTMQQDAINEEGQRG